MSFEADRTEILGYLMPGYPNETSLPETLTQKMRGKIWAHVSLKHFPDWFWCRPGLSKTIYIISWIYVL